MLALGGVAAGAPPAAGLPGGDCDPGGNGGLVSNLTGGVCELVDGVTDVVDDVTGDKLKPLTEKIDETGEKLHGGKRREDGERGDGGKNGNGNGNGHDNGNGNGHGHDRDDGFAPTDRPQSPRPTQPSLGPRGEEPTLEESQGPCLMERPGCTITPAPTIPAERETPSPWPTATPGPPIPTPVPSQRDGREREEVGLVPVRPSAPPGPRTRLTDTGRRAKAKTVDPERPRFEPLWPYTERLPQMRDARPIVRPARRSDVLGTALTAALLLSAILAARISHTRRAREEHPDSMPFDPMRARNGTHKLA
ncbi:hypothetical protein [Spongiactinospora rosea]|uniref:hypothetical protein n=1 Tax=Spongiactinospora rosea TaxID=2248750 RepID=UPI0011C06F08|nr:hypothetical protein [Spongiactinospora rosea]